MLQTVSPIKADSVNNTRVFQSGNSLAVRIPKQIPLHKGQEVELSVVAGEIHIRPVNQRKLTGLMDKFAAFSDDFMQHGRDQEQTPRESL